MTEMEALRAGVVAEIAAIRDTQARVNAAGLGQPNRAYGERNIRIEALDWVLERIDEAVAR